MLMGRRGLMGSGKEDGAPCGMPPSFSSMMAMVSCVNRAAMAGRGGFQTRMQSGWKIANEDVRHGEKIAVCKHRFAIFWR